jgi:hypothetical protein
LQERTKRKMQVLKGNGRDELLQVTLGSATFSSVFYSTKWCWQRHFKCDVILI